MDLRICIAIAYLFIGVLGILINGTAAALIATDSQMRHATYIFMSQLCICDCFVLLCASFYTGLALIWPDQFQSENLNATGGYVIAVAWYGGSCFNVLIAASRCVQLVWSHKVETFFSTRLLRWICACVYVSPGLFYLYNLIHRSVSFYIATETYSWIFNTDDATGRIMSILNIGWNLVCATIISVLNARSLHWVRSTRKQIRTVENRENRNREIRLFVQCAVTGCIYTAAVGMYSIVFTMGMGSRNALVFVVTHLGWMIVHLQNPLIYFAINERLRRRLVRLLIGGVCLGNGIDSSVNAVAPVAPVEARRTPNRPNGET